MLPIRIIVGLLATSIISLGSSWYASPTASGGSGSLVAPWTIYQALSTNAVQSGDTVYLRGGTYSTIGVVSTLTGATVRSYPGEWASVQDGVMCYLGVSLNAGSPFAEVSGVVITNSEPALVGQVVFIGNEQDQLFIREGANVWRIIRGYNGTSTSTHSPGERIVFRNDIIYHSGTNTTFRDFEITSVQSTNRVAGTGTNWWIGTGLNLFGKGNKAVDLIINNVGHPGIGFWDQSTGGEINGCIMWGNGLYDENGSLTRGSGVYSQNSTSSVLIKDNISFRNFTYGMKAYSESAVGLQGFTFSGNVSFQAPVSFGFPIEFSSGNKPMTNNSVTGNILMGAVAAGYTALSNVLCNVMNNIIVNGDLKSTEFISGIFTNNTVFVPASATTTDNSTVFFDAHLSADQDQLAMTWDWNTYYFKNSSHPNQYAYRTKDVTALASDGSGNLKYANDLGKAWLDWSGFDSHSTYATAWPTDYLTVTVQPLDYDTNKWHVSVVNTTTASTASVDLASSCGFAAGQRYGVRDAQNYPITILSGVYTSGTISLPLTLTNVSTIRGRVYSEHYTNEHTNVQFPKLYNIFVLERLEGNVPVTPRRSAGLRGFSL